MLYMVAIHGNWSRSRASCPSVTRQLSMRALTPKLGIKTIMEKVLWMVVVLPVGFALQAIPSRPALLLQ